MNPKFLDAINSNGNWADKALLTDLVELFAGREEALSFLHLYGQYGELVDDQVDEAKDINRTQTVDRLRLELQAHSYWQRYHNVLFMVERLVHCQYFDCMVWERSNSEWKRRDAKALSHCGYNMLFAVIIIEFGMEVLQKFSLRFREHAHRLHLNDPEVKD